MKCNPWRWLWGLIPIAMLSWITLQLEQKNIEADLGIRVTQRLEAEGLGWASAAFYGRDAVLTGNAAEEGDPKRAAEVTRKVWGVRVVDLRTDIARDVKKFVWSAETTGKTIRIGGFAPSEQTRRAIISSVRSNFPKFAVEDGMQIARGGPSRIVLLGGVTFALKQLASLRQGGVQLSGTDLSIAGEALDFPGYKSVRSQLANNVPSSVKVVSDKVNPPVVEPYGWSAKLGPNQLVLSGYVPDDSTREAIFSHAKAVFPQFAVVDRMETGGGAPDGFLAAAKLGIDELYQLKDGEALLSGTSYRLTGTAEDDAAAQGVRRDFTAGVPASLTATHDISVPASSPVPAASPEPTPATPVASGPYATTVELLGNRIELKGQVPNEHERIALVAAVRGRLPDRVVVDGLTIASGAPDGWRACLLAGVAGLDGLTSGVVSLSDLAVSLTGQTDDDEIAKVVPLAVRRLANENCATTVNVKNTGLVQIEAARKAEAARAAADAEAKQLADEAEAKRRAEEDAARRKAEAEQAALKAEDDARRKAREAEAQKCEKMLATAASAGVILFDRASADLTSKSLPTLAKLAKIVKECPGFRISIEGHTDAEGIPARNNPLSERRAKAVADQLVAKGVDASRLTTVGYGAERPISENETAAGRAKNRRIEFKVLTD